MIRYHIRKSELAAAIRELDRSWFEKAARRTDVYADLGRYATPPSAIWSDVKRAYMNLQGFKCGFCERRLERSPFGNVEHDVEHFRPKAAVDEWPPRSRPERLAGIDFPVGDASTEAGYFLLPHHPENYLIACKTCNSAYKQNGFPVEGDRDLAMASPRRTHERPLLCYPIGALDDDPQKLIRFHGTVPVPAATRGRRRRRGRVIINFFGLAERDGLFIERSVTLLSLHLALINIDAADPSTDPLTSQVATHLRDTLTADHSPHANCARSFVELWSRDRATAEHFTEAALRHLLSVP